MSEIIVEAHIAEARVLAQSTLDPADSRRIRSLGYLAEAEALVSQARVAVQHALAEINSAPAEDGGDGDVRARRGRERRAARKGR